MVTAISLCAAFALSIKMRTTIYVTKQMLHVNKAKIDLKYIKSVTALTPVEYKKMIGVAADPAAFLAINFWIRSGVKVELKDKKDPTPYWLISSRNPKKLVKALS